MKPPFLITFFIILLGAFFIWQGICLPKDLTGEEKIFLVEKNQGVREISANLEKEGLIKSRFFLNFYTVLSGKTRNLQTGEYLLTSADSITKIVRKIAFGDVVKEKITIIEGWDLRDAGFYLENKGIFQAEELWEIAGFSAVDYSRAKDLPIPIDFSSDYDFLTEKPKNIGLEGYLFPDTYWLNKGASIEEIVRKMLDNFDKKLTSDLREEIAAQGKSIFEIITMASLLEKEVKTKEEKEIASGIFWKRIEERMPLDSCATIAYILGGGNWTFEEMRKEIAKGKEIDSPYNTYKYLGLPLGPICNPGLESIIAAVYPKNSEYWYYFSLPDGETIFSRTLEEHNIAQVKYFK